MRTVLAHAPVRFLLLLAFLLGAAGLSRAEPVLPVVVELFTSQGCSSCPPADAQLAALARRPDVVALSLHVDYWDYLGWRDSFARPKHTLRQYAYRDSFGARVVYTPQMVVQGQFSVEGSRPRRLAALIASAQGMPALVRIEIRPLGGMLSGRLSPASTRPQPGEVWAALYNRFQEVAITRGENRGHRLGYANVVQSLTRLGDWGGMVSEEIDLPQPDPGQGVALWLQRPGTGAILAAAKFER